MDAQEADRRISFMLAPLSSAHEVAIFLTSCPLDLIEVSLSYMYIIKFLSQDEIVFEHGKLRLKPIVHHAKDN